MKSKQMDIVKSFVASKAMIEPDSAFTVRKNSRTIMTGTVFTSGANIRGVTGYGFFRLVNDMMSGQGIRRNGLYFADNIIGN